MKLKSLVTCSKCSKEGHRFVYYPYLSKKEKLEIHSLKKLFFVKKMISFQKQRFIMHSRKPSKATPRHTNNHQHSDRQ